ncbi:MAG: hypothetical protein VCC68_02510 [Myxococcota bacterium]
MSVPARNDHAPRSAGPRTPELEAGARSASWIGRDVAKAWGGRRRSLRASIPMVLAVLGVSLAIVVLRSDVLRLRFALSGAVEEEQRLVLEERELTVAMRRLRNPGALLTRARAEGFGQPEWIIDLDLPALAVRGGDTP